MSKTKEKREIIFEPDLHEREHLESYYWARALCSNCDDPAGCGYSHYIDVMILKGVKVPKKKFICPNCKIKAMTIV